MDYIDEVEAFDRELVAGLKAGRARILEEGLAAGLVIRLSLIHI